jgi:hypothetical protein
MIKTNFTRMQVLELMEYLDNRKDDEIFDTYQEELDYYVAEKQVNNINYTHCFEEYCDCDKPILGVNTWTCGCGKWFKKEKK